MGSVFSFNDSGLEPNELLEVQAETGFSKGNIKRLLSRFKHLDKDSKGYLIKEDLLSIPEIHFNPIGDRIADSFFTTKYKPNGVQDPVASSRAYFSDFARNFAVFRQSSSNEKNNLLNTKENKIRFLFQLIDVKHLGKFNKAELLEILEMIIGVDVEQDQLEHIVDRVVAEADVDEDGFVSFQEFKNAVGELDIEQKMAFIGFK